MIRRQCRKLSCARAMAVVSAPRASLSYPIRLSAGCKGTSKSGQTHFFCEFDVDKCFACSSWSTRVHGPDTRLPTQTAEHPAATLKRGQSGRAAAAAFVLPLLKLRAHTILALQKITAWNVFDGRESGAKVARWTRTYTPRVREENKNLRTHEMLARVCGQGQ